MGFFWRISEYTSFSKALKVEALRQSFLLPRACLLTLLTTVTTQEAAFPNQKLLQSEFCNTMLCWAAWLRVRMAGAYRRDNPGKVKGLAEGYLWCQKGWDPQQRISILVWRADVERDKKSKDHWPKDIALYNYKNHTNYYGDRSLLHTPWKRVEQLLLQNLDTPL